MPLRDPTAWMWEEALEMLERAERLQRRFFCLRWSGRQPSWEPPVDVFEVDDQLLVVVALPGVAPAQLDVRIDEAGLVVRGERPIPRDGRKGRILRLEIPHGYFERRIELPAGRYELRQQSFCDGSLSLALVHAGPGGAP